jgi:hypothetical protein
MARESYLSHVARRAIPTPSELLPARRLARVTLDHSLPKTPMPAAVSAASTSRPQKGTANKPALSRTRSQTTMRPAADPELGIGESSVAVPDRSRLPPVATATAAARDVSPPARSSQTPKTDPVAAPSHEENHATPEDAASVVRPPRAAARSPDPVSAALAAALRWTASNEVTHDQATILPRIERQPMAAPVRALVMPPTSGDRPALAASAPVPAEPRPFGRVAPTQVERSPGVADTPRGPLRETFLPMVPEPRRQLPDQSPTTIHIGTVEVQVVASATASKLRTHLSDRSPAASVDQIARLLTSTIGLRQS